MVHQPLSSQLHISSLRYIKRMGTLSEREVPIERISQLLRLLIALWIIQDKGLVRLLLLQDRIQIRYIVAIHSEFENKSSRIQQAVLAGSYFFFLLLGDSLGRCSLLTLQFILFFFRFLLCFLRLHLCFFLPLFFHFFLLHIY